MRAGTHICSVLIVSCLLSGFVLRGASGEQLALGDSLPHIDELFREGTCMHLESVKKEFYLGGEATQVFGIDLPVPFALVNEVKRLHLSVRDQGGQVLASTVGFNSVYAGEDGANLLALLYSKLKFLVRNEVPRSSESAKRNPTQYEQAIILALASRTAQPEIIRYLQSLIKESYSQLQPYLLFNVENEESDFQVTDGKIHTFTHSRVHVQWDPNVSTDSLGLIFINRSLSVDLFTGELSQEKYELVNIEETPALPAQRSWLKKWRKFRR